MQHLQPSYYLITEMNSRNIKCLVLVFDVESLHYYIHKLCILSCLQMMWLTSLAAVFAVLTQGN